MFWSSMLLPVIYSMDTNSDRFFTTNCSFTCQSGTRFEFLFFCVHVSEEKLCVLQECVSVRTLQLINSTDVPLSFTLNTQRPFSVLQHTHSDGFNSPSHTHGLMGHAERQHTQLLPSKHNMQVCSYTHTHTSMRRESERARERLAKIKEYKRK